MYLYILAFLIGARITYLGLIDYVAKDRIRLEKIYQHSTKSWIEDIFFVIILGWPYVLCYICFDFIINCIKHLKQKPLEIWEDVKEKDIKKRMKFFNSLNEPPVVTPTTSIITPIVQKLENYKKENQTLKTKRAKKGIVK